MSRSANRNRVLPWRRYLLAIIVCVVVVRTVWRLPRRTWSLEDSSQASGIAAALDPAAGSAKDIRHVILISIDTLRADHLGCYGYSRNTSPNIDALAAQSVLFNHAVAPVPITLPSHCSMLTGTIPPHHNVRDNIGYQLSNSSVTLAEILKETGFVTGAIVGAFALDGQFGLNQGFDTYDDSIQQQHQANFAFRNERQAEEVTQLANKWLRKHYKDKFFLFLHYYDPHDRYVSHEQFRYASLPFISRVRDQYDSEIAYTDYYLGRFIDTLKKTGIYDSSLIIFASDHGESLDEHRERTHTFFIYHSTVHVPLLIKLPGQSGPAKVSDVVGLIDIVPTVCGLLGIGPGSVVQGQDLMARFRLDQPAQPDRSIYCESLVPTKYEGQSLFGLVTKRYKYLQTARPELYDLLNDPHETDNLIHQYADLANTLRDRLIHIIGDTAPADGNSRIQLDKASLERLTALGYVGTSVQEGFDLEQDKEDPKDIIGLFRSCEDASICMFRQEYTKA